MTADIRIPAGQITPHGWWHLINDTHPMMRLRAYDGSIDTYLMGPMAPPFHDDIAGPECAVLKSLKGLIPPWKNLTQKGATQDGDTWVNSLYDRTDVQAVIDCVGRDQRHTRRVKRQIIGSLDAKQTAELQWFTQELGYWWADVRWWDTTPDPMNNQQINRSELSLRLSADNAFWRSFDHVSAFQFSYDSMKDTFTGNHATTKDCGPSWPQHYIGDGGGYCTIARGHMGWIDGQPYEGREVVNGPYRDPDTLETFHTDTNNQVISIKFGSLSEITWPDGAEDHIWGRMGHDEDGEWDGNGIKLQIGWGEARLSYYIDFVEHHLRTFPILIPPLFGEVWTLICGLDESNERTFKVLRGLTTPLGLEVGTHKELGTNSPLGEDNRGVGCGQRAGAGWISQATPASLAWIQAGDNVKVSQSGFMECYNIGDQPMFRDKTLFGPGLFRIYDGPGSEDYVEVGPLLPNQVAFLPTDPGSKIPLIQDLTSVPPSPQELDAFQKAVKKITELFTSENAYTRQVESMFGIKPAQGPLYSLMKGRFSENSAIPAKSPGRKAKPYYVRVEIEDGNADSMVISGGTPLLRYPV